MKKLKPRDFYAEPKTLALMQAENYDREPNLDKMSIRLEE
jgi:hypothetical protein